MSVAFADVVLRHKAGRIDDAAAGYVAILTANPRHAGALCNLAVLEAGRGEIGRAVALYETALNLQPRDAETLINYGNLLARRGDLAGAEQAFRRAVAAQPRQAQAWMNLGRLLNNTDRHDAAVDAFERAATLLPNNAEVLRERGVALGDAGRIEPAVAALAAALEVDPFDGEAAFHLGRLRQADGDLGGALAAYRLARDILGDQPDVLCNLGGTLNDLGRHAEAVPLLERAIDAQPGNALAANNLGVALDELGRTEEAIASYARAAQADPNLVSAVFNLGRALGRTRRWEEAAVWLRRAVALDPTSSAPRVAAASLLTDLNELDEAAVHWQRATELEPHTSHYHAALGYVMVKLKRPVKALVAAERAIALDPRKIDGYLVKSQAERMRGDEAAAAATRLSTEQMVDSTARTTAERIGDLFGLAGQCYHAGDFRAAARLYGRVLTLDPERDDVRARFVDSTLSLCDWTDYDGFVAELIATVERQVDEGRLRFDVFNLLALPVDNALLFAAAKTKAAPPAGATSAARHAQARPAIAGRPARLKIGFALPYTFFHSMPLVLKDLIERMDRDRFETIGYSVQRCDGTTFSRDFRRAFDCFRDVPIDKPDEAADAIAADGVHMLIDTTGHTGISCLSILARRPAPVQAHYLGYGLTSGAEYVDYLITDPRFIPPEWGGYCSERLVYLPDSFMATTRAPFAPGTTSRTEEGLPEQGLVLANFNHPCKLEPRIFRAWIEILRQVPDAVLWLGGWAIATRESLCDFAARHGVAPDRLVFARILPHAAHLRRLRLADLALDNLHHGGGVTSVDALWAGLPLLSIKGKTPAGRLGATLSHAVGLDGLVADDLEGYVALALALARDRDRLAGLKAELAGRLPHCALFDGARYLRHLQSAFDLMWRHRGEPRTAPPICVSAPD